MPHQRIKSKPTDVRDQLATAAGGVGAEADWPPSGVPTQSELATAAQTLATNISLVDSLEAQLTVARRDRDTSRDAGVDLLKRVDEVSTGLYGAHDPRKNNLGIPPLSAVGDPAGPIEQVEVTKIRDGIGPGAIFVDWHSLEDVHAYSVEWYSDSALTEMVGYGTTTRSDYNIEGLEPGRQYWVRARGVRGNNIKGDWSAPITHIASL